MKTVFTTVKLGLAACLVAAAFVATPSNAAITVPCANTDITVNGAFPTASFECRGFVEGNAINEANKTDPTASTLLGQLGYVGSLTGIETISPLNGLRSIDFNRLLFGETIIGVHYGNGNGSPNNGDGSVSAFYKFDAGTTGVDKFTLNFLASSNARLYKTGVGAVPEPATWMFMLLGMTGVGFAMRRKDKQTLRVRYT